MAASKKMDEAPEPEKAKGPSLPRFRLGKPWSCDRGYFPAGTELELPQAVAESLYLEGMGEIL